MVTFLAKGLDINRDLPDRCMFIASHKLMWMGGWFIWNLAAISILNLFLCFRNAHSSKMSDTHLLQLAVLLGTAGIAADLCAESLELGLTPQLAAEAVKSLAEGLPISSLTAGPFLALHRVVVLMSGYVGNSLYTAAVLLLTFATRRCYPSWVVLAGAATVLCGAAVSITCMFDSVDGMFWSNALIIPCLVAWLFGIAMSARALEKTERNGHSG